jgi:hypothetical protein
MGLKPDSPVSGSSTHVGPVLHVTSDISNTNIKHNITLNSAHASKLTKAPPQVYYNNKGEKIRLTT